MLPYQDFMTLLEMPGSIVKEALERSVDFLPEAEGHFLAVSGLKFTCDISQPVGERIRPEDILLPSGQSFDLNASYKVAVNSYIGLGGDNYDVFTKPEVKMLVDPENSVQIMDLLLQFFRRISTSYTVKEKNEARRQERLKLFNTSSTSPDDVSPDGKWIILRP